MNKKQILSFILLSLSAVSFGAAAQQAVQRDGGACNSKFKKSMDQRYEKMVQNVCNNPAIDTSLTTDGPNGAANPFIYVNPDQACDLGLQMPGLPDFGFGLSGIDSCSVLKAVTGDMVHEVNKKTQGAIDDSFKDITNEVDGVLPGDGFEFDLEDVVIDKVKK